jgi:hypothetical protein
MKFYTNIKPLRKEVKITIMYISAGFLYAVVNSFIDSQLYLDIYKNKSYSDLQKINLETILISEKHATTYGAYLNFFSNFTNFLIFPYKLILSIIPETILLINKIKL